MPVNGDPQDGRDAERRARSSYRPGWHPVDDARELEPGIFALGVAAGDEWRPYSLIRLVEIGGERGWRAVTAGEPGSRRLIGYWTTLRAACEGAHHAWLRTRTLAGAPKASWAAVRNGAAAPTRAR